MNKHVQVRNLKEATHRKLKQRAVSNGETITDYVKRLIEQDLKKPTWEQITRRLQRLEPLRLKETTAEMIRHERDSR